MDQEILPAGQQSSDGAPGRRTLLTALILIAAVLILYGGVLHQQFLESDDNTYIYENPLIYPLTPATVIKIFSTTYFRSYTPITLLSHAVDFDLWGLNPLGHHLTNLVLHALNTGWVFLLACIAIVFWRDPAPGTYQPVRSALWRLTSGDLAGAACAAALFAFHPLRVESVAWLSDRKDLLLGFFSFPALIAYLVYGMLRGTPGARRWWWAVIICSGLGMLSKTVGTALPLAFLLIDALFPRRTALSWPARVKEKVPLLIMSTGVGAVSFSAVQGVLRHPPAYPSSTLAEVLQPFYALAFYLWKAVWPLNLAPFYEPPSAAAYVISLVVVLVITWICITRARRGDSSWLLAWSVYVLFLLPTVLGRPAAKIQAWADRYTYLPGAAIALLAGGLLGRAWDSPRLRRFHLLPRTVATVVAGIVLVVLVVLTLQQIPVWEDTERLWRHAVRVDPNVFISQTNLAMILTGKGKADEAISAAERALLINPKYANAFGALGLAYDVKGDTGRAIQAFATAVDLDSNFIDAYSNLGNIYLRLGHFDEAIRHYQNAIGRDSSFFPARYNMGIAYYSRGDAAKAMEVFQETARINPIFPNTYFNMAIICSEWGDEVGALDLYRKAADLGLEDARRIVAKRKR